MRQETDIAVRSWILERIFRQTFWISRWMDWLIGWTILSSPNCLASLTRSATGRFRIGAAIGCVACSRGNDAFCRLVFTEEARIVTVGFTRLIVTVGSTSIELRMGRMVAEGQFHSTSGRPSMKRMILID